MTPSNDAPLGEWALWYAEQGWHVLPLDGKVPVTEHGVLDASTNLDLIAAKWSLHPDLNIGLRTGINFDALDVDSTGALQEFAHKAGHTGPRSRTGKKGYHLLYLPTGHANATYMQNIRLDWRGINGYIVAPPSIHPETGVRYEWQRSPETPLPEAPSWLFEGIRLPVERAEGEQNEGRFPYYRHMDAQFLAYTVTCLDVLIRNNVRFWRAGGGHYKLRCLWPSGEHDDAKPSLTIYPENNSFFCFGCRRYGGSPDLIALLERPNGHLAKVVAHEREMYGRTA